MRTKRTAQYIYSAFVVMFFVLIMANSALADSWWGSGYRDKDWVLKHGGTIIKYEINNISGSSNEYKAVMYDDDGDYVEKEFGTDATFDDAKNDKYKIRAYRVEGGIIDKTTHKGGKEFASIKVTAHPGETIKIKFDYKKKKAKMTTDYVDSPSKPVVKHDPVLAPPLAEEILKEPEPDESLSSQVENTITFEENKKSFAELTEEFFNPDNMAKISQQQVIIRQGDFSDPSSSEKEKMTNIFQRFWSAVVKLFNFD